MKGGGGGGGGGLSASGPIQNAFVGSIALGRQLITSLLFRPPLKAPSDPERNGPLDVQGIEQILKRNGLLKDSDIAIVLNVHLARRKELRSLKGMSYLYNLPLISRWIT